MTEITYWSAVFMATVGFFMGVYLMWKEWKKK